MKNQTHGYPGPWKLGGKYKSDGWLLPVLPIRASNHDLVCEIPYPEWEKHKANARLIAAAPDMLAALKEAMTTIDTMLGIIGDFADPWSSYHKKEWLEFCDCFDTIGEAVAKAEGGE